MPNYAASMPDGCSDAEKYSNQICGVIDFFCLIVTNEILENIVCSSDKFVN